MKNRWPVLLALLLASAPTIASGPPACEQLDGARKVLADELLTSQHAYDCCDRTLAECLQQQPVCTLAWRLANRICERVAAGDDRARISRSLSRRARSMMPTQRKFDIVLQGVPSIGAESAPVTLVEYACARCPFCAKLTPQLHRAIAEGPLKGKVRLYFKMFPIRNHKHSKEAGLAFVAAASLGEFWEFVLHAYAHFDDFKPCVMPDWATAVGLDRAQFEQTLADAATRAQLVTHKKEGIVNKVESTPTFFISGRRFVGDLTLEELIDVIEEEHDRLTGRTHR